MESFYTDEGDQAVRSSTAAEQGATVKVQMGKVDLTCSMACSCLLPFLDKNQFTHGGRSLD